jgi:hypothetical protein
MSCALLPDPQEPPRPHKQCVSYDSSACDSSPAIRIQHTAWIEPQFGSRCGSGSADRDSSISAKNRGDNVAPTAHAHAVEAGGNAAASSRDEASGLAPFRGGDFEERAGHRRSLHAVVQTSQPTTDSRASTRTESNRGLVCAQTISCACEAYLVEEPTFCTACKPGGKLTLQKHESTSLPHVQHRPFSGEISLKLPQEPVLPMR